MIGAMNPVIEIQDLIVDYGKKRALDGLSLTVERGKIFGFLGPNGAGKSTTIKSLLGLIFPVSGSIKLHGFSPSDIRSRAKIGFLPEEANYYRFLTPLEILKFYGEVSGVSGAILNDRIEELLRLVGLFDVRKKQIKTFSKGMVQKISLAQALVNDPETLILDEPTSGLDPVSRMDLRRILKDLKDRGKTIFFSSHELSEVELLCDSIAIVRSGRLLKAGSLKEVLAGRNENLERFFIETIHGEVK